MRPSVLSCVPAASVSARSRVSRYASHGTRGGATSAAVSRMIRIPAITVRMSRKGSAYLLDPSTHPPNAGSPWRENGLPATPASERDDLPRVHDVVGVDRPFQGPHEVEGAGAVLGFEILHLVLADAMLAGAGPLHGERPLDEARDESFDARDLVRIVHVDQRRDMEIAVPDMTDHRRDEARRVGVALRRLDAFGEPRDRHADVGRGRLRTRPQGEDRPVDVVAGLPQAIAVLGLCRPLERAAAEIGGDLAKALGLLLHPGVRAVELEEERRRLRERELGVLVAGPDLELVEELDAGDRDAGLDCRDHRLAGGPDRRERADAGRDRLRDAVQLERDLGGDAERPLRADEEAGEVI